MVLLNAEAFKLHDEIFKGLPVQAAGLVVGVNSWILDKSAYFKFKEHLNLKKDFFTYI